MDPIEKVVAWESSPKSSPQQSVPGIPKLQNIVTVSHDGAWREKIDIELRDSEDESYNGTITMQEAKYEIFRECLGFKDFNNFDGVRF